MEYKIISGRVVEVRRSLLPVRSAEESRPGRSARVAGTSSEAKVKRNERECRKELARVLNCNFGAGDLHVVLKYEEEILPESYEAAEERLKKFIRDYRREFQKAHGRAPKMVWVTANHSPKRNAPARLHHHLVIERDGLELASRLWTGGGFSSERMDNRVDHSDLAAYLADNVQGRPNKKKWHCSRNMARPIYTEPVAVEDVEDIHEEKGSIIKEHEITCDEDERPIASYIRCVVPIAPKVRGGRIVMPKSKAKGEKRE